MKSNTCISLCLLALAALSTSAVPSATSQQPSPSSLPQTNTVTPLIPLAPDEFPKKTNITERKGGGRGGGGRGGRGGSGRGSASGNDAAAQGAAVGGASGGKGGQFGSGSTSIKSSLNMALLCAALLGGVVLSTLC